MDEVRSNQVYTGSWSIICQELEEFGHVLGDSELKEFMTL